MKEIKSRYTHKEKKLMKAGGFLLGLLLMALPISVCAKEVENDITQVGLEDYVEKVFNVNSGMASNEANAVLQDAEGYIWIGNYAGVACSGNLSIFSQKNYFKTAERIQRIDRADHQNSSKNH